MKEFDQKSWDEKLQACQTHEEWKQVNADYERAMDDYERAVAEDAEANPEKYATHQDKSGRLYTLNPDGSRKYRAMRACEICGERNEADHESWWTEHMEAHEYKRRHDLINDPLVKKLQRYAHETHYGKSTFFDGSRHWPHWVWITANTRCPSNTPKNLRRNTAGKDGNR